MKGQDVLVLLAAIAHPDREWTFLGLAHALKISASEAHAAVQRLIDAGLLNQDDRTPRKKAAEEFLLHGLKYVFPCRPGGVVPGIPTAHSAEPLSALIASGSDDVYVWPHAHGSARGLAIEPLYRSAPDAALADPELYRLLALADALRGGRARERSLAAKEFEQSLKE